MEVESSSSDNEEGASSNATDNPSSTSDHEDMDTDSNSGHTYDFTAIPGRSSRPHSDSKDKSSSDTDAFEEIMHHDALNDEPFSSVDDKTDAVGNTIESVLDHLNQSESISRLSHTSFDSNAQADEMINTSDEKSVSMLDTIEAVKEVTEGCEVGSNSKCKDNNPSVSSDGNMVDPATQEHKEECNSGYTLSDGVVATAPTEDMYVSSEKPADTLNTSSVEKSTENKDQNLNNSTFEERSAKVVKKDLRRLMKMHTANAGDFAVGGVLSYTDLPNIPLIKVKELNCVIAFPFNESAFNLVTTVCEQSPFGMGEETRQDKSIRNSLQLDPDKFEITNEKFIKSIPQLIETRIKPALGLVGARVHAKLYKLLIYETGGKFGEHRDTEKEDDMFGTLIIQLPSIFTGGNMTVKHNNDSKTFKNSAEGSTTNCRFVAHYASCPHELEEITSGYRVALIYSLCWDGNGMKPSPYIASTNSVRLCNLLNEYMNCPGTTYLCWALEYDYSEASIKKGSLDFFKGEDTNVMFGLQNALNHDKSQFGEGRWELYIAKANKQISEYGECDSGGYRRGYYDDDVCPGHHDDWEENEREYSIDEFILLTGINDKGQECDGYKGKLKFDITPKNDILNFPRKTYKTVMIAGMPGYLKRKRELKNSGSDDEFWGTNNVGESCSGPTGNEGATQERWYEKRVVVFWRSDHSLQIKCRLNVSAGVSHVMDLLQSGITEEGTKGFFFLFHGELTKMGYGDKVKILKMCNILKDAAKANTIFKLLQNNGVESEDATQILKDSLHQFNDPELFGYVESMLKKTDSSKITLILSFPEDIEQIKAETVIEIIINHVLVKDRGYSYYGDRANATSPPCAILLEYMFKKHLLPQIVLNKFASLIEKSADMLICISLAITNKNSQILNLLVMQSFERAQATTSGRTTQFDMSPVFKTLIKSALEHLSIVEESLSLLVNMISTSEGNLKQRLLDILVREFLPVQKTIKHIPECLIDACRLRLDMLKQFTIGGTPAMSWNFTEAVVPGYPTVQIFMRGPKRTMAVRLFSGIVNARKFAESFQSRNQDNVGTYRYRHNPWKGKNYSCTMVAKGSGKNSYVDVVKTEDIHQKKVKEYNRRLKEYNDMLKAMPPAARTPVTNNLVCEGRSDSASSVPKDRHAFITESCQEAAPKVFNQSPSTPIVPNIVRNPPTSAVRDDFTVVADNRPPRPVSQVQPKKVPDVIMID